MFLIYVYPIPHHFSIHTWDFPRLHGWTMKQTNCYCGCCREYLYCVTEHGTCYRCTTEQEECSYWALGAFHTCSSKWLILYKSHSADLQVLSDPCALWARMLSHNGDSIMKYWLRPSPFYDQIRDNRTPAAWSSFSSDSTAAGWGLYA
jgi:hypothetical protein